MACLLLLAVLPPLVKLIGLTGLRFVLHERETTALGMCCRCSLAITVCRHIHNLHKHHKVDHSPSKHHKVLLFAQPDHLEVLQYMQDYLSFTAIAMLDASLADRSLQRSCSCFHF